MISFNDYLNEKTSDKNLKKILDDAYKMAEKAANDFMKNRTDGEGRDGSSYVRFNQTKKQKITPEVEAILLANGVTKDAAKEYIIFNPGSDYEDYDAGHNAAVAFANHVKSKTDFSVTVHKN